MPRKSKYNPETFPLLAEQYARNGLSDKQIFSNLGISHNCYYRYRNQYPEFEAAIRRGKKPVDVAVENQLLKVCMGYEYEEKTTEYEKGADGKPAAKKTKVVKKHVQPDTTAIKFWLTNRDPEKWRDKKGVELTGDVSIDTTKYTEEEKALLLKTARKGAHIGQ